MVPFFFYINDSIFLLYCKDSFNEIFTVQKIIKKIKRSHLFSNEWRANWQLSRECCYSIEKVSKINVLGIRTPFLNFLLNHRSNLSDFFYW